MASVDEAKVVAKVVGSLRALREKRGVSRYRLSKDTGLSPSGVRHMENGEVSPTLYFLLKVSAYLDVDLEELISKARMKKKRSAKKSPK